MNTLVLKLIALITMSVDHIGILYQIDTFRFIGRISFPLYAFLLVNGYYHTHNKFKYMLNLLLFGLISEIPFNLFIFNKIFYPEYNNIYLTLLIGLITIYIVDNIKLKFKDNISYIIGFLIVILFSFINELLHADYGFIGIMIIYVYYLSYNIKSKNKLLYLVGLLFSSYIYIISNKTIISLGFLLSVPLLYFYNNKRVKTNKLIKYLFYIYYPLHLILLYLLV